MYMLAEQQGKAWKLSRPFHGPFRVLSVTDTNVKVRLIDHPKDDPIFVHSDKVRLCYPEQGDKVWSGRVRKKRRANRSSDDTPSVSPANEYTGPMTRSRTKTRHD